MNILKIIGLLLTGIMCTSQNLLANESSEALKNINNYHVISEQLASSGMLELASYEHIKNYGFQHVINLIPGMQLKEKRFVESLDMTYEQIPVDWDVPTLENFKKFSELMNSYGEDKIYIHCELNWRASTFVFLYRVTQLGVDEATAKKDLEHVWQPKNQWRDFIISTLKHYKKT